MIARGLGADMAPHRSARRVRRPGGIVGLVFMVTASSTGVAEEAPADGQSLAEAVFRQGQQGDTALRCTMTLERDGTVERQRDFATLQRSADNGGGTQTLIRFYKPANIAGTALLDDAGLDAVWLYLPALDRVRRISSENRGGRFVNSQLYFEDLRERRPEEDRHTLLPADVYEGVTTSVLESVPRDPEASVYTRRVSWIHPDVLLPLRIDFFEGDDAPSKRLEVQRIDRIEGHWTITESSMTELASGDRTTITVNGVRYDQGVPATLFTTSALKSGAGESDYLP